MSEIDDRYEAEEEQATQAHDAALARAQAVETQDELLKFMLLAIVLLSTVVVIALLRPLIFNRIVPAVLGEGQPVAPLVTGSEAETIKPDVQEGEPGAVEESESEAGGEAGEGAVETTTEPENPEDFPTAVPAQTHTVQVGETLTAISRRYGVTVQAIVAANNITNPDHVAVGTVLIIPVGR